MKIIDAIIPRIPQKLEDLLPRLSHIFDVIQRHLDSLSRVINGRISFGDGTNADNIFGHFADVTADATPDVEFSVTHTTGKVPGGFIVLSQDRAGSLYKGGTAWTSNTIYLKCSVASLQARIFVI